jgi:transposase
VAKHVQQRVQIILLAFARWNNTQIARRLGLERHAVGRWRRRWSESVDALLAIEMYEPRAALERAVVAALSDAHRSGCPGCFSAQQIAQVVSTACESPRARGRPMDAWTGRELANEAIQRGLVDSISASRVNDLLRLVHLQPQRRKYWCFTTEKDHELFQSQVDRICSVYLNAQRMYERENTRTICVDEMTGLAANERRAETKPALPGQIAKVECQYTDYYHPTFAKPLNWTYSGRPTTSRRDQRPRTWREKTQKRQADQILALVAP